MTKPTPPPSLPPWLEVVLTAPSPQADAAADFLHGLSSRGVIMEEMESPPGQVRLRAFLAVTAELAAQRAQLERFVEALSQQWPDQLFELSFSQLKDQDWNANWKKHFRPRRVTWHLVVAPPWDRPQPEPEQQVLIIDPGQAFGTGQHESTLLCLRRLERQRRRDRLPETLLDLGCGTGILALAGLLMGAQQAVALDQDPLALQAARHNAELNNLTERITVEGIPLAELEGRFPLILANLTAAELVRLAPELASCLEPHGEIVASGMLTDQTDKVRLAFEAQGLAMSEQDILNGWAMLVLQ